MKFDTAAKVAEMDMEDASATAKEERQRFDDMKANRGDVKRQFDEAEGEVQLAEDTKKSAITSRENAETKESEQEEANKLALKAWAQAKESLGTAVKEYNQTKEERKVAEEELNRQKVKEEKAKESWSETPLDHDEYEHRRNLFNVEARKLVACREKWHAAVTKEEETGKRVEASRVLADNFGQSYSQTQSALDAAQTDLTLRKQEATEAEKAWKAAEEKRSRIGDKLNEISAELEKLGKEIEKADTRLQELTDSLPANRAKAAEFQEKVDTARRRTAELDTLTKKKARGKEEVSIPLWSGRALFEQRAGIIAVAGVVKLHWHVSS